MLRLFRAKVWPYLQGSLILTPLTTTGQYCLIKEELKYVESFFDQPSSTPLSICQMYKPSFS